MKKILIPLLGLLLLFGCEKETATPMDSDSGTAVEFRSDEGKVEVCHYSEEDGSWHKISISEAALAAHLDHGDAADMDGDGYFYPENGCTETDCDKDTEYNPDNKCALEIGDLHAGGIIFYLDGNGGGLVVATSDQGFAPWGCWQYGNYTTVGTSSDIGAGKDNTEAILGVCQERPIAASLARSYDGGGYDDWYLPSKEELNKIWENLASKGLGNFNSGEYWSSTEVDDFFAMKQDLNYGSCREDQKFYSGFVRAIRTF